MNKFFLYFTLIFCMFFTEAKAWEDGLYHFRFKLNSADNSWYNQPITVDNNTFTADGNGWYTAKFSEDNDLQGNNTSCHGGYMEIISIATGALSASDWAAAYEDDNNANTKDHKTALLQKIQDIIYGDDKYKNDYEAKSKRTANTTGVTNLNTLYELAIDQEPNNWFSYSYRDLDNGGHANIGNFVKILDLSNWHKATQKEIDKVKTDYTGELPDNQKWNWEIKDFVNKDLETVQGHVDGNTYVISAQPFADWTQLQKIILPDGPLYFDEAQYSSSYNASDLKDFRWSALTFAQCPNLTDVVVGDYDQATGNVTEWTYANADRTNNEIWKIHNAYILYLGNDTFRDDTNLTTESYHLIATMLRNPYVSKIGWCTFQGCKNINKVIIPANVKKIDRQAFNECEGLEGIAVEGNSRNDPLTIGIQSFANCHSLKWYHDINTVGNGRKITNIGDEAFLNDYKLEVFNNNGIVNSATPDNNPNLDLDNAEVKTDGSGGFIDNIRAKAFKNCVSLKYFYNKRGVIESIGLKTNDTKGITLGNRTYDNPGNGDGAFENCVALTNISPNILNGDSPANDNELTVKIKEIYKHTFLRCWGDNDKVVIPASVEKIDDNAFQLLSGTKKIIFKGDATHNINIGSHAFQQIEKEENLTGKYSTDFDVPTASGVNINDKQLAPALEEIDFGASNFTFSDAVFQGAIHLNKATFAENAGLNIKNTGTWTFEHSYYITNGFVNDFLKHVDGKADNRLFSDCDGRKTIAGSTDTYPNNLTDIIIPTNITAFGGSVFAGCQDIKTITLTRETAPTCPGGSDGVFHSINSNDVELVFTGDAAKASTSIDATTGYYTYLKGDDNSNDFHRLLTKTLTEGTTYDGTVVPQQHAIVVLKRNFKAGWNTVALPFGSPVDNNKPVSGKAIYNNAFFGNPNGDTETAKIAVYRGVTKEGVLKFLNLNGPYANGTGTLNNTADQALADFQPLLIKLPNAMQSVTFTDVDLNIEHTSNGGIATKYGKNQDVTATKTISFNGEDETDNEKMKAWLGNILYDQYDFTGHYNTVQGSEYINPGDYIIQDGSFVLCKEGKTYGLNGFRGFFKARKEGSAQAKPASLVTEVFDGDSATPTEIIRITTDGNIYEPGTYTVYNMNGQLVRSNATSLHGLAKGLYIVNGKKSVIK